MQVAVLHQSLRGSTERAAEAIGAAFDRRDVHVGVFPVDNFDWQFVAKADLIVLGTWTDGLLGLGAKPAQIGKLNALPSFAHKPTALFVTYEISPKRSLREFRAWATDRDVPVVAEAGVKARKGPFKLDVEDIDVADFVDAAISAMATSAA